MCSLQSWFPSLPGILCLCSAAVASWILSARPIGAQGYSLSEAAQRMTVAAGFQAKLVAGEPLIRKPAAIEFDDRGRLWVLQYLQYPNPAGLQRVKVDRYSRTVYDRIPEPPPRGPKGADRITILEDIDGQGRAHKAKDFLSGLNLATGIAFGHGGVFVLQAPYMLFYPDHDGDDVPDGDPEVLLRGFGMEDASALANSLTWGPDGWLYGCQGSTVTAHIRGIEFQQGIWRYHPISRRFELFCEGGGNAWGLDFDRHGNLFYSTNYGGFCMVHGVQGGYYWKQFGKHGALHNPYTYGYFDHVQHHNFRGGHVTVGGIVYQGDSFPERFRGKYIAADLLGHNIYWHNLESVGSTFRSAHGGEMLLSNDTWFAPSDVTLGPDGSIYIADWHDKRTAHPDPDAEWDRSRGRIYKLEAAGAKRSSAAGTVGLDLTKLPSDKLVALLSHPNDWYVRKARRILADRRDPKVLVSLRSLAFGSGNDALALQALWALYVSGGFDEDLAGKLLGHRNPDVRRWTVRFLGDDNQVSPTLSRKLAELAETECDVTVRSQLLSSAKRLPARDGLPIVQRILLRNLDGQDAHIPLLAWWAVEHHAITATDQVLDLFASPAGWKAPLIRASILERLMRRYAAEGTEASYTACARLLTSASARENRQGMLAALEQGLQDRPTSAGTDAGTLFAHFAAAEPKAAAPRVPVKAMPPALEARLGALWKEDPSDSTLVCLMARLGHTAARERAQSLANGPKTRVEIRVKLLQLLGEIGGPADAAPLLELLTGPQAPRTPEAVQLAALAALQRFDRDEIAAPLLHAYPKMPARVRARTAEVLFSRQSWTLQFLKEIDRGQLPAKEIGVEQLRLVALHKDKELDRLVRKHWGNIQRGTPEDKLAEMRRLSNDLRAGSGDPVSGRAIFQKRCATCHRLFDEGTILGPDLTHANRNDRDYLLVSLVDPSALIRKEFLSYHVQTKDGRFLTGLIAEQNPGTITLLGANNERTRIAWDRIETIQESPVSLMPENLLKELTPQELRDLFSYLQSEKPPVVKNNADSK